MNTDAWSTLDDINHTIRFADTKASVLLAAAGVIGGTLLSRPEAPQGGFATVVGAVWGAALVAVALSAVFCLGALLPRLKVVKSSSSLLYFDDIARQFRHRPDDYVAVFARFVDDPNAVRAQVASQIWANSLVARRKFHRVRAATWCICFGLVGAGAAVFLERL